MATTVLDEDGDYTEVTADAGDRVIVIWLCEQDAIVLRPGVLYLLEAKDGCDRCTEIATSYGYPTPGVEYVEVRPVTAEEA